MRGSADQARANARTDTDHSAALSRLERLLKRPGGFEMILLDYGEVAYRDQVIGDLAARGLVAETSLHVEKSAAGLQRAIDALAEASSQPPINLLGLDAWLNADVGDKRIDRLNFARERLAEAAGRPLLIWVNGDTIKSIAHGAPDFWSWRSAVLDFTRPSSLSSDLSTPIRADSGIWSSAEDNAERLAELDRLLEKASPQRASTISLCRERGDLHYRQGKLDLAIADFESAKALALQLDEDRSAAIAAGRIADIMMDQGRLDEAEAIRREDELPVYERLGDIHSKAVTLGKTADILMERGRLDEAEAILREEELPVYERLGDIRSKAATLGKIADILVARGRLDEAEAILREEELPVYERLGDIRSKAVTLGKIADILMERGRLDEAEAIRREEELPVYERLGDIHSKAITLGQIADILMERGRLDEAEAICREEQLPVYERLGDIRSKAATEVKLADIIVARGGDVDEARRLYGAAREGFAAMGIAHYVEIVDKRLETMLEGGSTDG